MMGLLVAGTTSDAGKTVITTGLCRVLSRRGINVAPYKAQNMSNNSMVCAGPDGQMAEIGRAQWIQALAAGVTAEPAMNPVLLKPGSDNRSHVVLMGQPAGAISSENFLDGRNHLAATAHGAFDDLRSRFDLIIAEGAGSPTEINLRSSDYVNLGLAQHAQLPVVVVGDIDRGGVFAAMYGTVALLRAADQALIAGFVINKFRGDAALLRPGIDMLEQATGRPVFGTVPWNLDLWLDSEDALDIAGRRARPDSNTLRVAVIRLPRISNFTDVDALGLEPDVDVVFASNPQDLSDADLIIIPGTRTTIGDLDWLRARGLDRAIVEHANKGRAVLGICGGAQMLGHSITDPQGIESPAGTSRKGLRILDIQTTFTADKTLALPSTQFNNIDVNGYEIHHGKISVGSCAEEFPGGCRSGNVFGTMWHGSLENDAFRSMLLTTFSDHHPSSVNFAQARNQRLDTIADLIETHLDVDALLTVAVSGAPAGLPVLPPAGL